MIDLIGHRELLSTLVAGMLDGLLIVDAQGRHLFVNDALCRMLGFSREELLGTYPPHAYWPSDELPAIEAAFARTFKGDVTNFELVFQRKDGARVEVILAPAELRHASGEVVGYFATVKDITERKRLERSHLESERRWRSIVENPFDFVVLIDRDYRYTFVNHVAPGVSADALIGKATPFDFVDPAHHSIMRSAFESVLSTGRATSYDVHVPQLDAWYSSVVGPVFHGDEVIGLSILTRETTAQKRTEEALRQSQQRLAEAHRLEMVGTLAGGVAHDINNLLTPILGHTELAQFGLAKDHPAQTHLTAVVAAAERAAGLVRRVLLLSRMQEPKKHSFDLRDVVREDCALVQPSIPKRVQLTVSLPDDPVHLLADRVQVGQVVTNLVSNALQATSSNGGTVKVELARVLDAAVLTVSDTGVGMDSATLSRVFEPFFTTKAPGTGTGLGLSIAYGVVREHGGEISVESRLGAGSVFTVRLPIANRDELPNRPILAQSAFPERRRLRILLVDDEPAVAEVARAALAEAGHTVSLAGSPRAALELFSADPGAFDLVLTDQSMPVTRGTELIAALRRQRPGLRCILMTGYEDEATRALAASLEVPVLGKPFSLASLADAVM